MTLKTALKLIHLLNLEFYATVMYENNYLVLNENDFKPDFFLTMVGRKILTLKFLSLFLPLKVSSCPNNDYSV